MVEQGTIGGITIHGDDGQNIPVIELHTLAEALFEAAEVEVMCLCLSTSGLRRS